ncbi:MAG: hypothetical protein ACK5MT_05855 [Actinomycetales bacterium]
MSKSRPWIALTVCAVVAGAAVSGCTINRGSEASDTTSSSSASDTGDGSTDASSSPATPAFGSDVSIPVDGVGEARLTNVDTWTFVNELDNSYARVVSPPQAPDLASEAQRQVNAYLAAYRALAGVTPTQADEATDESSSTSETQAGSDSSTAESSASDTVETTAAGDATSETADTSTEASEPAQTGGADSLRSLSQVIAARPGVYAIRLYSRATTASGTTEQWKTYWYDPAYGRMVDATALFASARSGPDPLSTARQLAIAAAPEGQVGQVSDRDLFSAAAFTTTGDLVLYLDQTDAAATQVVLAADDVEPLLSDFGRQAKVAAADAVVGPSEATTDPTPTSADSPAEESATSEATQETSTP